MSSSSSKTISSSSVDCSADNGDGSHNAMLLTQQPYNGDTAPAADHNKNNSDKDGNNDNNDGNTASCYHLEKELRQENDALRRTVEQLRQELAENKALHTRTYEQLKEAHEQELAGIRHEAREHREAALLQSRRESEDKHKADRLEIEKMREILHQKDCEIQRALTGTPSENAGDGDSQTRKIQEELWTTERQLETAKSNLRQLRSLLMHAEKTMTETTQELAVKLEQQQSTIERLKAQLKPAEKTNEETKIPTKIQTKMQIDKVITILGSNSEDESSSSDARNLAHVKIVDVEGNRKPAAEVSARKCIGKPASVISGKRRNSASENENYDGMDSLAQGDTGTDAVAQADINMPSILDNVEDRKPAAKVLARKCSGKAASVISRKRRSNSSEIENDDGMDTLAQGDIGTDATARGDANMPSVFYIVQILPKIPYD